ncbi:MAG: RHS repeat-associated core domain-containing protein [Deltaproteobacteria bacterium]|nr:RHS repeat-associated core domain-containing protein [Deltaproteobacteria bacterium]
MSRKNEELTPWFFDGFVLERAVESPRITSRASVPVATPADPSFSNGALTRSMQYDGSGNPVGLTDAKGQTTTTTFGILNRAGTTSYASSLQLDLPSLASVTFTYDGNGNRTQIDELKNTIGGQVHEVTNRGFDSLDRLKSETRYDGKVVKYGYDFKGNRTSVTDPDLAATTYLYDGQDRLHAAITPDGTTYYTYDFDSLLLGSTEPNGVSESRGYDAARRLSSIDTAVTGNALSHFGYTYDANGNRATLSEQRTNPSTQTLNTAEATGYGYDLLDRLVAVAYPDGHAALYNLDPVGNRIGERSAPTSTVGTLDALAYTRATNLTEDVTAQFNRVNWLRSRSDALNVASNVTFAYDANGNVASELTSARARALHWDVRDTLTDVVDNGVTVGVYDYCYSKQRVKRATANEHVEYVLDDKFVLEETDGSQASHPSYRRYHYANAPLEVVDQVGSRFYTNDAEGSPSDLTNLNGTVQRAIQYDAWGKNRNNTAPTSAEPKLGYTGHQLDVETGLVYARARYYDSELGIFLSSDPREPGVGDAPWLNRYLYVKGNPLIYEDPDGLRDLSTEAEIKDMTPDEIQAGNDQIRQEAAVGQQQEEECARIGCINAGNSADTPIGIALPGHPRSSRRI